MILMAVTSSFILRLFASGNYLRNYQRCRRLFKGYEACLLCVETHPRARLYILLLMQFVVPYSTIPLFLGVDIHIATTNDALSSTVITYLHAFLHFITT